MPMLPTPLIATHAAGVATKGDRVIELISLKSGESNEITGTLVGLSVFEIQPGIGKIVAFAR